jgi:hypothetical protein
MIKPFDLSWLPILPAQARQWFQELYDQLKGLFSQVASIPMSTQNAVTGSRAVNTVYRNATGKPMFVLVTFAGSGAVNVYAQTDASNPPGASVGYNGYASGGPYASIGFWVLPGNYYKLAADAGTAMYIWTE